jgi:hypothetical protein
MEWRKSIKFFEPNDDWTTAGWMTAAMGVAVMDFGMFEGT